jgi:hypothetical protein
MYMIEPWMHDIIRRVIASQGRPCEIKPAEMRKRY